MRGWDTEWILEDHGSLYSGRLCIVTLESRLFSVIGSDVVESDSHTSRTTSLIITAFVRIYDLKDDNNITCEMSTLIAE